VVRIKYCGELIFDCGRLMKQSTELVSRNSSFGVFGVCFPAVLMKHGFPGLWCICDC
jgi:hypothetical protein